MNKNEVLNLINQIENVILANYEEKQELVDKLEEVINTISDAEIYEIVLYGADNEVIYKGNNDYHEIAHTIHEYLNTSNNFARMGINEDELLNDIKCEALYNCSDYTKEQAESISESKLSKLLMKNDTLLIMYEDLSNEYYYDLIRYFVK